MKFFFLTPVVGEVWIRSFFQGGFQLNFRQSYDLSPDAEQLKVVPDDQFCCSASQSLISKEMSCPEWIWTGQFHYPHCSYRCWKAKSLLHLCIC